MAKASFTSGNDYAAFNGRPYELPINQIAQTFSAKNNDWMIGASRIKSRFNDALDLDLSKPENIRIRDEYLKKAQEDLKTLNSKDLTNPDVQKTGMNLFSNLLKDPGIKFDDQATKHYKKILSNAEQARKTENGKYYSDDNLTYALDGWDDFLKSPDRMAGADYLKKAKEFTPYYDYSAEVNTTLKNCKPDEASSDSIAGMYMKHTSNSSLSASKITGCLDAGLSDKAWKQLSINGYSRYKNNPQALRDSYLPLISGERENLSVKNASYSAILANKDKLSKLKPEELKKMGISDISQVTPQYLQAIEQEKMNSDLRLENLNKTIDRLSAGDLSDISGNNFEPIAGRLYAKDYMENVGRGFSYNKTQEETKSDPVQLMIYGQNRQDQRQEDTQNFQLGLEERREQFQLGLEALKGQTEERKLKLKAGQLNLLTPGEVEDARHFNPAFENNVEGGSDYEKMTQTRQSIAQQKGQLNMNLLSNLRSAGLPDDIKSTGTPEFKAWYNSFGKTLPPDDPMWKTIKSYEDQMVKFNSHEDIIKHEQEEIDGVIRRESSSLLDRTLLPKEKIRVNNTVVSASDIQDAIEGKPSVIQVKKGPSTTIGAPGGFGSAQIVEEEKYYVNNKEISGQDLNKFLNLRQSTYLANAKRVDSLKKKRDELAKERTIVQTEGFAFPQLNDKDSPFKQRVAQRLGVGASDIDKITIGDTDLKGNFLVSVNDDMQDPDFKSKTIDRLKKNFGVADLQEVPNQPGTFKVSGFEKFNIVDPKRVSSLFEPLLRAKESRTTPNNHQSTGLVRSINPHAQFGLEIIPGLTPGTYTYRLYNHKNETIDVLTDRKTALQKFDLSLNAR